MPLYTNFSNFSQNILKESASGEEIFEIEIKGKDGKPESDLIWAKSAQEALAKYKDTKKQNGESVTDAMSLTVNTLSYEQIQKMKDKYESEKESVKKKITSVIKDYRMLRDELAATMGSLNKLRQESDKIDVDEQLAKIDQLFRGVAKEDTDHAEERGEKEAERAIQTQTTQARQSITSTTNTPDQTLA